MSVILMTVLYSGGTFRGWVLGQIGMSLGKY